MPCMKFSSTPKSHSRMGWGPKEKFAPFLRHFSLSSLRTAKLWIYMITFHFTSPSAIWWCAEWKLHWLSRETRYLFNNYFGLLNVIRVGVANFPHRFNQRSGNIPSWKKLFLFHALDVHRAILTLDVHQNVIPFSTNQLFALAKQWL